MPQHRSLVSEEHVSDRAYDEAIPVEDDDDDDEVSTPPLSEDGSPMSSAKPSPQARLAGVLPKTAAPKQHRPGADSPPRGEGDSESESSNSESSESGSEVGEGGGGGKAHKAAPPAGAYNPEDFEDLAVSPEIQELFGYIGRYKPSQIDLETSLRPFIPELIPSIGEVDAFLKMPRPDGEPSNLGNVRLDEPTLTPSNSAILDMKLISLSKHQDLEAPEVRTIENAEKNPKEIEDWVTRIEELNRSKPAPTMHYSSKMPDIEHLMQIWPTEFEESLQQFPLPDLAELDLELPELVRIFTSILDVPVYSQITETLHFIFTLYSEFKANQHFSKTDNAANFGPGADAFSYGPVPNFSHTHGQQAMGTMAFGPSTESVAPSRHPSPVGGRGHPHHVTGP